MSQAIVVACPRDWTLDTIDALLVRATLQPTTIAEHSSEQLAYTDTASGSHVAIRTLSDQASAVDDYAHNELIDETFRQEVRALKLFVVDFRGDVHLVRSIVEAIARECVAHDDPMWFDTDFGKVLSARAVLELAKLNSNWDWRPTDT